MIGPPILFAPSILPEATDAEAPWHCVSQAGGSAIVSNGFRKPRLLSARARTLSYVRQWLRPRCPDDLPSRCSAVWGRYKPNEVRLLFCS